MAHGGGTRGPPASQGCGVGHQRAGVGQNGEESEVSRDAGVALSLSSPEDQMNVEAPPLPPRCPSRGDRRESLSLALGFGKGKTLSYRGP